MNVIKASKFMSMVLRHKPEEIGIQLDSGGWADIDELIRLANQNGVGLSRDLVVQVVSTSDKQRFITSVDGVRIRANQGHSISVDLDLTPRVPPDVLFHGTASRFIESIRVQGLLKGQRHHVHLSTDEATALKVGQRHGHPIVLKIFARRMHEAGSSFFLSENGVWLVDHVPVSEIDFSG